MPTITRRVLIGDFIVVDNGQFFDKDDNIIKLSAMPMIVDAVIPGHWIGQFGLCEIERAVIVYVNLDKNKEKDCFEHVLWIFHGNIRFKMSTINSLVFTVLRHISIENIWIEQYESSLFHLKR